MGTSNEKPKSPAPERGDPDKQSRPSDPGAISRAIAKLRPYLLHIANQSIDQDLQSKAGASDLVNDTLLDAHQISEKFEGRTDGEMRAWLKTALHHKILNYLRLYRLDADHKTGREVPIDTTSTGGGGTFSPIESTLSPSGQAIRKEQEEWINLALGRLEERDRQVVIWRNHENQPFEEIGRRLGGSDEMARKVWTRALLKLRDELGEPPDFVSDIRREA